MIAQVACRRPVALSRQWAEAVRQGSPGAPAALGAPRPVRQLRTLLCRNRLTGAAQDLIADGNAACDPAADSVQAELMPSAIALAADEASAAAPAAAAHAAAEPSPAPCNCERERTAQQNCEQHVTTKDGAHEPEAANAALASDSQVKNAEVSATRQAHKETASSSTQHQVHISTRSVLAQDSANPEPAVLAAPQLHAPAGSAPAPDDSAAAAAAAAAASSGDTSPAGEPCAPGFAGMDRERELAVMGLPWVPEYETQLRRHAQRLLGMPVEPMPEPARAQAGKAQSGKAPAQRKRAGKAQGAGQGTGPGAGAGSAGGLREQQDGNCACVPQSHSKAQDARQPQAAAAAGAKAVHAQQAGTATTRKQSRTSAQGAGDVHAAAEAHTSADHVQQPGTGTAETAQGEAAPTSVSASPALRRQPRKRGSPMRCPQ